MKIRSHLLIFILGAVLPILAFSAVMTAVFWREQREALEQRFLDRVRGMTIALDREIDGNIRSLQMLAESPHLQSNDLLSFYEQIARALSTQSTWANIILNDPASGRQVINLRFPFGAPLPETTLNKSALAAVVQSGKPFVAPILKGRVSGSYTTTIVVPAKSSSGRQYTLVAVINPASWLHFLSSYPVASDATLTLLDQNGIIIARTLNHERWVGQRPSPGLAAEARKSAEGTSINQGLEGQWFYTAHSRSKLSGWTLASGVPKEGVEAALRQLTVQIASVAVASAVLAILLALLFGRRIARPVSELARSAQGLVTGQPIRSNTSTCIAEVDELREAFSDAAERLRTKDLALQDSEERFRSMADTAPVLLWLSDIDKQCTYFNKPWLDFTGRTLTQELGEGWVEGVHPEDHNRCLETYRKGFNSGKRYEMEYRLRHANGEYRWVLSRGAPRLTDDGEFVGYVGSCVDITERKEAEESLREVDRRKDEYLAMLGHELRNPLGVISMSIQLLRQQAPSSPRLPELRDTIDRQVGHMTRLLDDLLDVSRISRGQMKLNQVVCDFASLLGQTVQDYRSKLESQDLHLQIQIPERPLWVMGDRTRLAQIISNILHNAEKFTGAGGTITAKLWDETDSRELILTVRDTGIGMEPKLLAQIFEPFTQGDHGIERNPGGLGLGLPLVKGLIELHGGRVHVSSDGAGQGFQITIRLPLVDRPASPDTPDNSAAVDKTSCRILVIEDNRPAARMMTLFLTGQGHTVEVAHTGREGLKAARGLKPDVILCDIGLPEFDGYKVVQQLRQEPDFHRVYLIGISGYGQEHDKERAWQAGFDAYLVKPIDLSEVERLLAKFCQENGGNIPSMM
jgi:PAS domain S-box-containing protein